MPDDVVVRTVPYEQGYRELLSSDDLRDYLLEVAEPVVRRAQAAAPKRTGQGAASIRSEPVLDGFVWTARVSWTRQHYYMYFHDQGTVHLPASEFLELSLGGEI